MYGIGSRFLASSAPSSLSVKHIEREIRNKCRKGELLPAMEAIRQLLNNDKTPSQDCLGNILHYCQETGQTEHVDEIFSIAERVLKPDVPLVSAQISCLSVMGELGKAWNIFQSSVNNSVIPRRGAALHLTNTALDQNDESKVLQMLDFYRKEEYKIADHGASKIILAAIKDKKWTDAVWKLLEIYKHSLLPFEESIAYKFVNWFESERGECNTEKVVILKGNCPNCGHTLMDNSLTESEHNSLSQHALKYLEKEPLYFEECERETREVSIFKSFLSHVGPFGAVIDGMNVSHAGGKRNIERLVRVGCSLSDHLDQPVLAISRRHLLAKSKSEESKKLLLEFKELHAKNNLHFFVTQNRVADDKFFIYGALSSSAFLVTGDGLGDYHHSLPPPLRVYFKKWQRNKQISFVSSIKRLQLQYPRQYDSVVQWTNDSVHIPLVNGEWLCVLKKTL